MKIEKIGLGNFRDLYSFFVLWETGYFDYFRWGEKKIVTSFFLKVPQKNSEEHIKPH